MPDDKLIWPARLHHLNLTSEDPQPLVDWYSRALMMEPRGIAKGETWLRGKDRHLIISDGPKGGLKYAAYTLENEAQLIRLRNHIREKDIAVYPSPSPLMEDGAFMIADPDGNQFVLGICRETAVMPRMLPGRLQHVVFRTTDIARLVAFHSSILGFRVSDVVKEENGEVTATFMRSDPEHHSLGIFRASETGLDHFCSESTSWDDIRDWGNHFAGCQIPITWGAGRHGAGNNLFIFVTDQDGNNVEISAEIEHWTFEQEPREWLHEQRTLNLWGSAWLRS